MRVIEAEDGLLQRINFVRQRFIGGTFRDRKREANK